jgi:hypothetical protein
MIDSNKIVGYHFTPTENLSSIMKIGIQPTNVGRWAYKGYLGLCPNCGQDHWEEKYWNDLKLKKYTGREDSVWVFQDMPFDDVDLRGRLTFIMMNSSPETFSVTALKCYYEQEQSLKWIADQAGDTLRLTHTGTCTVTKSHPDDDKKFEYHCVPFDLVLGVIPPDNLEVVDVWSLMVDDFMKNKVNEVMKNDN